MREPTYYATDHVTHTECDRCHEIAPCVVCEHANSQVEYDFCRECSDKLVFLGKLEISE